MAATLLQQSMRPTRFCLKCGEYIALVHRAAHINGSTTMREILVHTDTDGEEIHRAHAPIEDMRGHKTPLVKPPKAPTKKAPKMLWWEF